MYRSFFYGFVRAKNYLVVKIKIKLAILIDLYKINLLYYFVSIGENMITDKNIFAVKSAISNYYSKYKRLPTITTIVNKTGLTKEIVRRCVDQLKSDKELKKAGPGRPPIKQEDLEGFKPDSELINISNKNKHVRLLFYKIILILIFFGSITISGYYTMTWCRHYLHISLSVTIAAIMVIYSGIGPNLIYKLWKNKNNFIAIISCLSWIIVLFFSMFSTVAGQYDKFIKVELSQKDISERSGAILNAQYENTEDMVDYLKERVRSLERQKTDLADLNRRLLSGPSSRNTAVTLEANRNTLSKININIAELTSKIMALGEIKNNTLIISESKEIKYESIFDWLSGIFKIRADILQLIISIWPAIFLDLIAPLCLLIFETLKENDNE
jgi:hypothetical protein